MATVNSNLANYPTTQFLREIIQDEKAHGIAYTELAREIGIASDNLRKFALNHDITGKHTLAILFHYNFIARHYTVDEIRQLLIEAQGTTRITPLSRLIGMQAKSLTRFLGGGGNKLRSTYMLRILQYLELLREVQDYD